MIGIYKFTNKIDGKCYIGQSVNIRKRYNQHKGRYNTFNHQKAKEDTYFHYVLRNYGFDNFDFEIVEECSLEELNNKEIYYISKFNSLYPNGYNLTAGGNSPHTNTLKNLDAVVEIQNLLSTSTLSNIEIGKMYGVTDQTISDINNGNTWFNNNISYPIRNGRTINRNTSYCHNCGKLIGYKTKTGLCNDCYLEEKRKHIPDKDTLFNLLLNNTFTCIANKYGVSSNAVRKWCDTYGIPRHSGYYRSVQC